MKVRINDALEAVVQRVPDVGWHGRRTRARHAIHRSGATTVDELKAVLALLAFEDGIGERTIRDLNEAVYGVVVLARPPP